jgi:hypothetical protein
VNGNRAIPTDSCISLDRAGRADPGWGPYAAYAISTHPIFADQTSLSQWCPAGGAPTSLQADRGANPLRRTTLDPSEYWTLG